MMIRHRLGALGGSIVALSLSIVVTVAVATPPQGVTRTELARSTIAGPVSAAASGASELAGQMLTFPPGGESPWHSHTGATFVAVKAGALTLHHGDATGCTSHAYPAGTGFLEPAGDVHFARNEGPVPAEIYVTVVALPAGAPLRTTEADPGGANCPSASAAAPQVTRTDLARAPVAEPFSVVAAAASDLAIHTVTVEPGGSGGWHKHPGATFVAVKSGTLTHYHGDATACTARSVPNGTGFVEPVGELHVSRNEGTTPVELYVTFLASPVGAALRIDQGNPGGANCPVPNPAQPVAAPQATAELPRTGGAGPTGVLAALGFGLAALGTSARLRARSQRTSRVTRSRPGSPVA